MDGGVWWTGVHGVAKSRIRLSDFAFTFSLSCIGEGNGNPLQCSCLENPRGMRAWWADVYGVTQSRTGLKWLSSSSMTYIVFIPIPKKSNAKERSNYHTIPLISHASKVMLKILQARLQQYMNHERPDVQAGFRKGRGTKLPASAGSSKKQESSRKTSTSALLTMPKPLIVWITINCGKFWKRWVYQITWPASWGICVQVRQQQLDLDMEQQTCSK